MEHVPQIDGTGPVSNVLNAHDAARCCATCGRELDNGADVWLRNTFYTAHGYEHHTIAAHCTACTERRLAEYPWKYPAGFRPPAPCASCGRSVHVAHDYRRRVRIVCSTRCRELARNTARRAQRHAARQRPCHTCGQPFAGRRDRVFCSTACRMRAWRQRQHAAQEVPQP
jgi:hypothetical protein